MVGNMKFTKGFTSGGRTKNIKFIANLNKSKRPVSAIMSKRVSPNTSVDLPIFDLNRMRPKHIRRDKMTLYDDAMKLK